MKFVAPGTEHCKPVSHIVAMTLIAFGRYDRCEVLEHMRRRLDPNGGAWLRRQDVHCDTFNTVKGRGQDLMGLVFGHQETCLGLFVVLTVPLARRLDVDFR